jgi:2-keto-3-deoxy-galactonokinase
MCLIGDSENSAIAGQDVISWADRLTENMRMVTGGNLTRALVLAIRSVESDIAATDADSVARAGVLALLRERLAAESERRLMDEPIPYELVYGPTKVGA